MKISFIIITWNRASILEQVLRDIRDNCKDLQGADYEVVLHNEEADAQTREIVEQFSEKLPIVYSEATERLNSCGARNACLDRASGDLLVFIDDDVRLTTDFVDQVLRCSQKYQAFSCRINNVRTPPPRGIKGLVERAYTGRLLRGLGYFVGGFSQETKKVVSVDHLPGCIMVFHREVVGDTRFDVRIGEGNGYLDDADFSHTIKRQRGVDLKYVPYFSITHLQAQSGGNRVHDHKQWYSWYWQHKQLFFKKHIAALWYPCWVMSGMFETLMRSIIWRENLLPIFFKVLHGKK